MAAWDVSDLILQDLLARLIASGGYLGSTPIEFHLYTNDYSPAPGADLGDFTEASFPGYAPQTVSDTEWGAPSTTAHVSSTVATITLEFDYTSGPGSDVTVYGYFATGDGGDYVWSERFATPRLMSPGGQLKITPEMRTRTYPAS